MSKLFSITTYLGGAAVALMTLISGIDIVGRYVLNSPLPGAFDLTGNLLAVIAACGFVTASITKEHISVDSLYVLLPKAYQFMLDVNANALEIIAFLFFSWQGFIALYQSITPNLEVTPGTPAFVTFPFRLILALGFTISFIISVYTIVRLFQSKSNDYSKDRPTLGDSINVQ
jgi:TRAP-type C4-dicarboxylate transport system permease small subunit